MADISLRAILDTSTGGCGSRHPVIMTELSHPLVEFAHDPRIASGWEHSCGIRADQSLACWVCGASILRHFNSVTECDAIPTRSDSDRVEAGYRGVAEFDEALVAVFVGGVVGGQDCLHGRHGPCAVLDAWFGPPVESRASAV